MALQEQPRVRCCALAGVEDHNVVEKIVIRSVVVPRHAAVGLELHRVQDVHDGVIRFRHAQIAVGLEDDYNPRRRNHGNYCLYDQQRQYHPRQKSVEALAENVEPSHANRYQYEGGDDEKRKEHDRDLPVVCKLSVLDECLYAIGES
mmetsp:Transcript_3085/g.8362  ORF Transcript_3085/g.8362 Transcript_3085/m.8362 type:complete len:147 (-) Transcript_3085:1342-1782(-)